MARNNIFQFITFNEILKRRVPEVVGVYLYEEDRVIFDELVIGDLTYSFNLDLFENFPEVQYAEIYKQEKDFRKFITQEEKDVVKRVRTFLDIYSDYPAKDVISGVIPEFLIKMYYGAKSRVTEEIFAKSAPRIYTHLAEINAFLERQKRQPLSIDGEVARQLRIQGADRSSRGIMEKMKRPYVVHEPYGVITGRLSEKRRSFPIHGLKKNYRNVVIPTNDLFFKMDLSSADFRVFLHLFDDAGLGKYDGVDDLYMHFSEFLSLGDMERSRVKKHIITLIYDKEDNEFLDYMGVKEKIKKYIVLEDEDEVIIQNVFGRTMRIPKSKDKIKHLIISYLMQSTTNDIVMSAAMKMVKLLEGRDSHVAFTVHDEIVLDMTKKDYEELREELKDIFSDSKIGKFAFKCFVGKNFRDLEEVNE